MKFYSVHWDCMKFSIVFIKIFFNIKTEFIYPTKFSKEMKI